MLPAPGVEFPPAVEGACHARGDLRIEGVDRGHLLGEEGVAAAVGGVKAHVVAAEAADQRVDLVRIVDFERRVREQFPHFGQRAGQARARLHCQPLVHHQRFVLPFRIEGIQRLRALGAVAIGERGQRRHGVGHVVGAFELPERERARFGIG